MKSSLALASIILSLSSSSSFPFTLAAPHPQSSSSSLQDISLPSSSSTSSSHDPQVLLTISTLSPTNTHKRISHKTIPIALSGDKYGSYLEGFANLPASDHDDDDDNDSNGWWSSSSAGLDLRLSSISFTSTGDVDSPICSFRIAEDASRAASADTSNVVNIDSATNPAMSNNNNKNNSNDNNVNTNTNESFRANIDNTGSKRVYGKPFPGGDGRSIMGNEISGGIDRMVNGVYCIAANKKWGEDANGLGDDAGAGAGADDFGTANANMDVNDNMDVSMDNNYDDDDEDDDYDIASAASAAGALEDLDGGFDGLM